MRTMLLRHESAEVVLKVWSKDGKYAIVNGLLSMERGEGHATALMQRVTDYADKHDITLTLVAKRFGWPMGPDNTYLVHFFEKFGFMPDSSGSAVARHMSRPPRTQK